LLKRALLSIKFLGKLSIWQQTDTPIIYYYGCQDPTYTKYNFKYLMILNLVANLESSLIWKRGLYMRDLTYLLKVWEILSLCWKW